MNRRVYIARVTPMSRTRPALSSNRRVSMSGSPKSLTRSAPETLNRSAIIAVMLAFRL